MTPSEDDRTPIRTVQVLLVEDAMDHALLVMTFLRAGGPYEVTHVQDGDRAIRMLDDRTFDLLVTDLNLPGTDGFQVMRHVTGAGLDIPMLAITGYTDPQHSEEAYRAGAGRVLHKPLLKEEVLAAVVELLPDDLFERQRSRGVLAVGARPGDVEVGCGGALSRHAEAGQDVVVLLLDRHLRKGAVDASGAAQRSAEHLGARLVLGDEALGAAGGPAEKQLFVGRLAEELDPRVAYAPWSRDDDTDRAVTGRLAAAALQDVPLVLAYPTATTGDAFEPDRFTDVGDQLAHKAEALAYYQGLGANRKDLEADFIQERATHWGRLAGADEAEAFLEVHARKRRR